ncbi:PREDICTED: uncharacterized protein LOC104801678 [Tarenaya hassleriana]|uniref:uncharacterized protein LOC104801678 n=1 Tax=Tarenaya hassleriana TaxID=28532 RepID=UPI00053C771C|nr:PREDICTED: uncharacterized protein LOC104801678 [Tarenaya hassleriana]
MATEETIQMMVQVAILLLTLAMFWAVTYLPKRTLANFRTKHRATVQTQRQLIQASRLLARARTTTNRSHSLSLAKSALAEADDAISLSPDDAAAHIVRALALDLLGHRTSALKSFDSALTYPRVKSLSDGERADALVKRAEMKLAVNRRRRIGSAIEDLEEAVKLADAAAGDGGRGDNTARMHCVLGECYEFMGLKEKAHWAYDKALKAQPSSAAARDGLNRSGS